MQEDVASPYYNRIDFEVVVDKHGRPVPAVEAAASDRFSVVNRSGVGRTNNNSSSSRNVSADGRQWRHLAVLVCPESVTVGGDKRTPGRFDLHVEQLELQGYEVSDA